MRDVLAMRVAMGVDTVRLCTLNATSEQLEHIRSAAARRRTRRSEPNHLVGDHERLRKHRLPLAFNTLVAGLDALEDEHSSSPTRSPPATPTQPPPPPTSCSPIAHSPRPRVAHIQCGSIENLCRAPIWGYVTTVRDEW
jgi:hypothetical protein